MSGAAERLAAYLDQRRRLGEPALAPFAVSTAEIMELAAAARARETASDPKKTPRSASAARRRASPDGGAESSAPTSADPRETVRWAASADYDDLRKGALGCTRCRLAKGRKHVAFSDGSPDARLVVVGEAPGAEEDATGLPFVGQAGKLLDLMLGAVGLSRKDSVYICNVLKCRPPGNRNPMPDEIDACAPFLKRQIELVAPGALLAVGAFAANWLVTSQGALGSSQTALGKLRGQVYRYAGVPLVVTYHPAALLRNPAWNRLAWDDLQLLRQVIDE